MVTRIIAVRHGETEWNRIEKQQGHLDSNLTDQGKLQAKSIGNGLQKYDIDKFYSSDLGRAKETSQIISSFIKMDFQLDERLRERNLGNMQGLTKKEYQIYHPHDWSKFNENSPDYELPKGESIRQRYNRAINCVEELAKMNRGKTILIVSHGGILMSLIYKTFNLPLSQKRSFSLFNGAINEFSISEEMDWRLEVWGDTNHLKKYGLETIDDN